MKRIGAYIAIACLAGGPATATTQEGPIVTLERMSVRALRIVESAMPEFERRVTPVDGLEAYEISVHETKNEFIVIFMIPPSAGAMGNPSDKPGLEVYIEKETLRVLRSHFIR